MRKKRLYLNTGMALLNQAITLICGFILPQQILRNFGSNINGLISSITQFLGFITLMDMGVGAVVQSSLYQPIAKDDKNEINKILTSSDKFFQRIALILIVYTIILMFFFPAFIDCSIGFISTLLLVLAISISSIAQYFFGLTNQIFLNANQKSYISLFAQSISTILNTIVSVLLIKNGASINVVKFCSATVLLSKPVFLYWYVNKKYPFINKNVTIYGEPIKQKWNGLAQHLATFVVDRTDVAILTIMSTLTNVSIYNVYHLVVVGLYQLFIVITNGIQSLLGDMYAKNETEKLMETFSLFEWLAHNTISIMFSCAGVLLIPFIKIYTKDITDTNYILPLFSWIITVAYAFCCLRGFYNILIKAVGHYKQTQTSAIVEALLNIGISIWFVPKLGLAGIAFGTLTAMAFRTFYFAIYLQNRIIKRSIKIFIINMIVDIIIFLGVYFISKIILVDKETFGAWIIEAIIMVVISTFFAFLVNGIFNRRSLNKAFLLASKKSTLF